MANPPRALHTTLVIQQGTVVADMGNHVSGNKRRQTFRHWRISWAIQRSMESNANRLRLVVDVAVSRDSESFWRRAFNGDGADWTWLHLASVERT